MTASRCLLLVTLLFICQLNFTSALPEDVIQHNYDIELYRHTQQAVDIISNTTLRTWISLKRILQDRVGDPLEKYVIRKLANGVYAIGHFINHAKEKGLQALNFALPHVTEPKVECEGTTCNYCAYASVPTFDFEGRVCMKLEFDAKYLGFSVQLTLNDSTITELNMPLGKSTQLMFDLGKWFNVFFKSQFHDIRVVNNTIYSCLSLRIDFPFSSLLYLEAGCYYLGPHGIGRWINSTGSDTPAVQTETPVAAAADLQGSQVQNADRGEGEKKNQANQIFTNKKRIVEVESMEGTGDRNSINNRIDKYNEDNTVDPVTRKKRKAEDGENHNGHILGNWIYDRNRNNSENKKTDETTGNFRSQRNSTENYEELKDLDAGVNETTKEDRVNKLIKLLISGGKALICGEEIKGSNCNVKMWAFVSDIDGLINSQATLKGSHDKPNNNHILNHGCKKNCKAIQILEKINTLISVDDWEYLSKTID